jgi:MoaA/NifB/PqqE/SkfB family radical SAM enzyme
MSKIQPEIATVGVFKNAMLLSLKRPSQAFYFAKSIAWQKKAAKIRREISEKEGICIPPVSLFSITKKCNLKCKGCYDQDLRPHKINELSGKEIENILLQAQDLGIAYFVLIGGEPFVRNDIVEITAKFPKMIFLVFTNGLLLDDSLIKTIRKQKNIIPILSLEGTDAETDERRGCGVFKNLTSIIKKLKNNFVFFGTSLTVTSSNFSKVTDTEFVKMLSLNGCKAFFFIEYTAINPETKEWEIDSAKRLKLPELMKDFRKKFPSLFIAIPSEEEQFGGCLSAGRGFIHISAEGKLEPCPFAPFEAADLRKISLKDALKSEFLKVIRENSGELHETEGGCALWAKRDWVYGLLEKTVS